MIARDAVCGHHNSGYISAMQTCLVSRGFWRLGPGMVIRGLRGRVAVLFRGRDIRWAAFPGRRRSVGSRSCDARCASLLPPSMALRWCRIRCIVYGTRQGLVDTVLAICLAIGTSWLFIVALDLMKMSALTCFPFYEETVVTTLRRRQKEHASTARLRGRPVAVILLSVFGPM